MKYIFNKNDLLKSLSPSVWEKSVNLAFGPKESRKTKNLLICNQAEDFIELCQH